VSGPERIAPARRAAFEVLRRSFEQDAWADRAFPAAVDRHGLDARDRALAQRLSYGAIQRRGTLDHLIAELADRAPEEIDPPLRAALRLGLYELLYAGGIPDHAAVDQAVELAKVGGGGRGSGLVNAVLRRAARQGDALLAGLSDATPAEAAVAHSHPRWLAEMWWSQLGADGARRLMAADNEPAETALRVNTLRARTESIVRESAEGEATIQCPAAAPAPPESLVVLGPIGESVGGRIEAGELVPQSRASAFVVVLLDPRPGERVLDLCAGPGVKTTQIAARIANRGEITAVERDPGRASELRELCSRLGAESVRVIEADAGRDDLGGGYDRVLVDPPCSDLGTLASRPDARWRKSPQGIAGLARLQERILARGAAALRPGGTLVYSTCTISRRENEDVVLPVLGTAGRSALSADALGSEYPGLASPHDSRLLQTRPDRDRTDGFFIARLRRGEARDG
jgi:16S rRNA (cytosine967-C5)-methyltransferase